MAFSLLDAVIKVTCDDKASAKIDSLSGTAKKALKGIAIAGVTAVGTATAAVVKGATEQYANYEQLVGGIQKLYGETEGATEAVAANARDAYKSVGMSMNEYMENAMGFSAALINSLGGDSLKAAETADKALRDIADNANTFGKFSVEELTNVYQALARGNYQTLDNLNLGYAGTKEGMEKLIAKANELREANGEMGDLSIESYADMVEAIHEVQNSMNITGTTEKEAASTIQGSLNMVKAAWKNMMLGMSDDGQDFDGLIQNLLESAMSFGNNLIPVMARAFKGFGKFVQSIAPTVIAELPNIAASGVNIITELASGIISGTPMMLESAINIISTLGEQLMAIMPQLGESAGMIVLQLVSGIITHLPQIAVGALQIITALASGITSMLDTIIAVGGTMLESVIDGISAKVSALISSGVEAVKNFIDGIGQKIAEAKAKGAEIVNAFKDGINAKIGEMASAGLNLVRGVWNGISSGYDWIVGRIQGWVSNVVEYIKSAFGIHSPSTLTAEMGMYLVKGLAKGITDNIDMATNAWDDVRSEMFGSLASEYDGTTATGSSRGGGMTIVQNISATPQTPVELAAATEQYFSMARWAMA